MSDVTVTEVGQPFPCPNCGATDEWKADYYEATWQGCEVVTNPHGQPDVVDYTGVYGHYDDGSTENDQIVCQACNHEIELGTFLFVPAGELVMSANQAVDILFGEDAEDADAPFRSGADIAAGVAAFFKFTPMDYERLFAARKVES